MDELKASAKQRGLWALGHPAEIGGGGLPLMPFVYLNEIIGRSRYGQIAVGSASMQESIMLHLFASKQQRERWLKPLLAGDINPMSGLTEPGVSKPGPTLWQTHAELDGDVWVINGGDCFRWYPGGQKLAFFICFAVTDREAQHYLNQFSIFIVPAGTLGCEIFFRPSARAQVYFTNVRVTKENLLGCRGEGFYIAQKRLGPGRIFHCMRSLGQAQRTFELMCDRAKSPLPYETNEGKIQRYIAESAAEIQAARLMTLDAAEKLDRLFRGRVKTAESLEQSEMWRLMVTNANEAMGCNDRDRGWVENSLIKFWGARVLHNVIDRAIQVHGALATGDTPLEKMYREARHAKLDDGLDGADRTVVERILRDPVARVPWGTINGGES